MRVKVLFLLGLFSLSTAALWGRQSGQPKLIHRYENGYSLNSLTENAAYLADSSGTGGTVAVRICSKKAMPTALFNAAADPFLIAITLKVDYDFTPERILFLRSEVCLGADPEVAATELWAIPHGAALPASVESISSSQVQLESVGAEAASVSGARNYRAATQELITKLRGKPQAVGIVLGYYYQRPNPVMRRRLNEVRRLLERSRLPPSRYSVRLARWIGDRSVDPPEPEPRYPSVSLVGVTRDSARR